MIIYFIRHGEIKKLKKSIYYGYTDVELSKEGVKQAYNLKEQLVDISFDRVYTSPLKRTLKTSEVVFKKSNIPILQDRRIMERNFGAWEQMSYKEIKAKHPEECSLWESDWIDYCIREGESTRQFITRVREFIDDILKFENSSKLAVVSHNGVICASIAYLLGMGFEDLWRFRVDKGSVSKVVVNASGYAYLNL